MRRPEAGRPEPKAAAAQIAREDDVPEAEGPAAAGKGRALTSWLGRNVPGLPQPEHRRQGPWAQAAKGARVPTAR